jgi:hypothetical protein
MNCVAGSVMLSHTTAQHVCAGHSLHMKPSKEALKLLLLCAELLHESGGGLSRN